jgi:hypothetical protein
MRKPYLSTADVAASPASVVTSSWSSRNKANVVDRTSIRTLGELIERARCMLFASNGNDGSLLRVAPAASCDQQAVPAQIAVRGERTEDVLRAPDQQTAKVRVSFLRDPSLRRLSSVRM